MKEKSIETEIEEFVSQFDETWFKLKTKEFNKSPFLKESENYLEIKKPTESEGSEIFEFNKYCLHYFNRPGEFKFEDCYEYQWIGYQEMEMTGKPSPLLIGYNIKMLVRSFIDNVLNRYIEASKTAKIGIIRAIDDLKSVYWDSVISKKDSMSDTQYQILLESDRIFKNLLDEKYSLDQFAHTRPIYSKVTLDFDVDRTRLTALIYLLLKCKLFKESPENIDACFEYFRFKKKGEYHLISTKTNLTNLLGEFKKGKYRSNLDELLTDIQEVILELKERK